MELTQAHLQTLLHYNPLTGVFVWRVDSGARKVAGRVAGTPGVHHPCIYISIKRRKYLAHRLAWLYVYGAWPAKGLDHKDGDASNNRILNLREATPAQQQHNLHRPKGRNPYVGVYQTQGKWAARINGAHIGYAATPELARELYLREKAVRHTHHPE